MGKPRDDRSAKGGQGHYRHSLAGGRRKHKASHATVLPLARDWTWHFEGRGIATRAVSPARRSRRSIQLCSSLFLGALYSHRQLEMKSCRISLVLLCFFFAVIVPGLSADESTSLSNAAIVLPFKVDPKVATAENLYLGFAVGNLLENVLAVHDGLEECWLNWHLPEIFPAKEDLQKWLDSNEEIPAKTKQLRIRFIVTGEIRRQGKELAAAITLLDQSDDKRLDAELIVDLPVLQNFRAGFLDLLAKSAIEPSPVQRPKMLWEEDLAQDNLALMGKGIHDFLVASHYGEKRHSSAQSLSRRL